MNMRSLIMSVVLCNIMCAVYAGYSKLPTESEVIATGHPLTLALFAARYNVEHNNVKPDKQIADFKMCLNKHPLLKSRWVAEKGFINDLVAARNANSSPERVIKENQNYTDLPFSQAKMLLFANLMDAFNYCNITTVK